MLEQVLKIVNCFYLRSYFKFVFWFHLEQPLIFYCEYNAEKGKNYGDLIPKLV